MDEILKQLVECVSHIIEGVAIWWLVEKIKEHKKQQKKKTFQAQASKQKLGRSSSGGAIPLLLEIIS